MNHRISGLARISGLMLILLGAARAGAADQDALLQQMTTLNGAAIDDYSAGDFDKAKGRLLQAAALGKKDPVLRTHPLMARTYLHLGVLYVDGFEDRKAGIGYLVKALKIRPDIDMADALVTKTVTSAFVEAKKQAGVGEATASVEGSKEKEGPRAAIEADKKPAEKSERPPATKEATAQTPAAPALAKPAPVAQAQAAPAQTPKEEKRLDTEATQKLQKALAAAEGSEAKERAAREKLTAEKLQKDKELGESKTLVLQLQKDQAEKAKQAVAEKQKLEKELALVKDSDAKERTAKEKLTAEKQATEKALAETRAQVQQLQKDKADKEKQLAETAEREKKEKEAKEKLLAEKQAAETREKDRKAKEEAVRLQREKMAAGPELPAHFAEPVYCNIPDEVPAGVDLFVHCVAKSSLNAKGIALYYRSNTGMHYNSVELEPAKDGSKKGWSMTVIPASRISGKAIQYYVEAFDATGAPIAANGKPASPNILALRSAGGGSLKSAAFVKKR
jgi:hypothetical protein